MTVIEVTNLKKEFKAKQKEPGVKGAVKAMFFPKYKQINAVNNISFTVKKGEMVGFIGPNGAGKSTTIKMMSGILFPTSGKIKVLGFNPQEERKKLAFKIGTVFGQKPQLWYHLPAIDTFNLFSKIYEIDENVYQQRLKRLVKMFGIKEFLNQPVRKLSLGQRMRCELVASLLHNPQVLFLDEPSIGLDIIAKKRIRELIRQLNEEEGVTVILTSHDMDDVEQVCNRLVIINHGKIVYDGSTKHIREKYLRKKVIKILLPQKIKFDFIAKGVKVIPHGEYRYDLEVDTSVHSINKLVQEVISKYKVEDLSILDPPIEEIIEQIYLGEVK